MADTPKPQNMDEALKRIQVLEAKYDEALTLLARRDDLLELRERRILELEELTESLQRRLGQGPATGKDVHPDSIRECSFDSVPRSPTKRPPA